jgi:choline-sulfatase
MKNVILIMSDGHNHNFMGCAGNQIAHTPNLDLLAKNGTTLTNCYAASPSCTSARSLFLSGQSNSQKPALAYKLSQQEIHSFYVGKMSTIKGKFNLLCPRFAQKRNHRPKLLKAKNVEVNKNHKHDILSTRHVCRLFEGAPKQPFFAMLNYLAPHPPLAVPAKRYVDRFMDQIQFPNPPWPAHEGAAKFVNQPKLTREESRKVLASYYGMIMWMDERVGELMNSLHSTGLINNSEVIYTSDHGNMMGHHGLWSKPCLYDGAIKVPLIISDGEHYGVKDNVCSSLDVSTTIARKLGVEKFGQGRNLTSLLKGKKWKDWAFAKSNRSRFVGTQHMVRLGKWKYIYTHNTETSELYNLDTDPNEKRNVAIAHPQQCSDLHVLLVDKFRLGINK